MSDFKTTPSLFVNCS